MRVWKQRQSYGDWLESRGYEQLGEGSYATVYARPGDKTVVKVGDGKDAYPIFLEWAVKNGFAGKEAPAVKSFKRYRRKGSRRTFYVAEIERLEETVEDSGSEAIWNEYSNAVGGSDHFSPWVAGERLEKIATKLTRRVKRSRGLHFDLHDQNFMVRSNGELVVTDPIFYPNYATGGSSKRAIRRASNKLTKKLRRH
jgi:hypothetical protein